MLTTGIVVMAVMMGAMFLLGGHGKKHKHAQPAAQETTTTGGTAVSTAAVQNAAPAGKPEGAQHRH